MTENMKLAIVAINKFIFFSWNYESVEHSWEENGVKRAAIVPRFLADIKWSVNFSHIYSKWNVAISCHNPDAYLPSFYKELDTENRRYLLEYVISNYHSEQKILGHVTI